MDCLYLQGDVTPFSNIFGFREEEEEDDEEEEEELDVRKEPVIIPFTLHSPDLAKETDLAPKDEIIPKEEAEEENEDEGVGGYIEVENSDNYSGDEDEDINEDNSYNCSNSTSSPSLVCEDCGASFKVANIQHSHFLSVHGSQLSLCHKEPARSKQGP